VKINAEICKLARCVLLCFLFRVFASWAWHLRGQIGACLSSFSAREDYSILEGNYIYQMLLIWFSIVNTTLNQIYFFSCYFKNKTFSENKRKSNPSTVILFSGWYLMFTRDLRVWFSTMVGIWCSPGIWECDDSGFLKCFSLWNILI
jgi:hypothetical protein